MDRVEFMKKVDAIGRSFENMDAAILIFEDGARHITYTHTIEEGDLVQQMGDWILVVSYVEVHTMPGTGRMVVPLRNIKDVLNYSTYKKE